MSNTYPDLTNAFPDSVDPLRIFQDVNISNKNLVDQYNGYVAAGNFTAASNLIRANPSMRDMIINADNMQLFYDAVISLERHYMNNFYQYVVNALQYRGTWSSSTRYSKFDLVRYAEDGLAYLAVMENIPVGTLPTSSQYWIALSVKGEQGESGLGMTPRGTWSSAVQYYQYDVVTWDNKLWWAKADNRNSQPFVGSNVWEVALSMSVTGSVTDTTSTNVTSSGVISVDVLSVNNLTSTSTTKPLSAYQGNRLNSMKANINSPSFTGSPYAPNPGSSGSSQIATVNYVIDKTNGIADGKANIHSPTFTGTPYAPNPDYSGSSRIATTYYVNEKIKDIKLPSSGLTWNDGSVTPQKGKFVIWNGEPVVQGGAEWAKNAVGAINAEMAKRSSSIGVKDSATNYLEYTYSPETGCHGIAYQTKSQVRFKNAVGSAKPEVHLVTWPSNGYIYSLGHFGPYHSHDYNNGWYSQPWAAVYSYAFSNPSSGRLKENINRLGFKSNKKARRSKAIATPEVYLDDVLSMNQLIADNIVTFTYIPRENKYENELEKLENDDTASAEAIAEIKEMAQMVNEEKDQKLELQLGIIAEDIADHPLFDFIGIREDEGMLSIKQDKLAYISIFSANTAINRIAEQATINDEQTTQIAALASQVADQATQISEQAEQISEQAAQISELSNQVNELRDIINELRGEG